MHGTAFNRKIALQIFDFRTKAQKTYSFIQFGWTFFSEACAALLKIIWNTRLLVKDFFFELVHGNDSD